ncbi:ammonium transporter [Agitococcus lubricus]|uniref:Ammonium transporter n=1 Tax=Agitococcus lubricus TaxID=1077255 RepID=A0A2T5J390_9GAMM|nr:ammonium transporter [Agitococcus lubricus]PTQ91089.1 ammonium transporter [Agitococcus lubricus]
MFRILAGLTSILLASTAFAADTPLNNGNTAWILTATALVLFMTLPGLALFYGGLVRTKNVLSILMQCFAIASIISLLWLVGFYSLAFTDGGSLNDWLGGGSRILMAGLGKENMTGDIPEIVFAAFQMTFAIITPALIIGAFAERMKFSSVLIFSVLWTLVVYVPVAHSVWGGGYFFQRGLIDFAGGTVVHITAGVAALVAALVLGPRQGFGKVAMPPHNLTMTVTGAGMLWVGWYGFNAGSALAANGAAGMALFVTHIAASAGALTWMVCEWLKFGKPSVLGIVTGMVAGLGTITGAAGVVGPAGALVVGILAGAICFVMTNLIKKTLKIDDSLDVFPVHGVGGILGTFLAGIFCSPDLGVFSGLGYTANHDSIGSQLTTQVTGILVIGLYTALATWVLLKLTAIMTKGLRVTDDEEREGLDLVLHEERGYDLK